MDGIRGIVVFALSVFVVSTLGQKCFIKNKHNALLSCVHDNKPVQLNPSGPTWVQAGTECTVTTTTGQDTVACIGPNWMIGGTKEISIKKVRHKRSFVAFLDVLFCVLTFFSCLWSGRAGNSDQTPPILTCPPPIYRSNDAYQTYAKVTWTEPTAWDNRDGKLRPTLVSGRASGLRFPAGRTEVQYAANDKAGNRGSCGIIVNVIVVNCPPPKKMTNGYYLCWPSTEFVYGGHCRFGCYMGFDLHGSNYLECKKDGQWSDAQPECRPLKCNHLGSIEGAGQPKCTDKFNFRSICEYDCGTGYDMPPKVSKALVCTQYKNWSKHGYPRCVDIEPPRFVKCPDILMEGVDIGGDTAVVNWTEPEVYDNSGQGKAYLQEGDPPGSSFKLGPSSISYYAKDKADNKAPTDCRFSVVVRDIRCPRLYPTPYMQYQCESGYRAGAQCNVSCDPGKKLNGTDHVGCNISPIGLYGEWDWPNRLLPKCEITRKCVDITPPENGAVVCDNWEGGQYCQIQCRNGTEMPSVNMNKLYVCDIIGDWKPRRPSMKTCRVSVRRGRTRRSFAMKASFYFDGECTDDETQQEIAENFIAVLQADKKFQREVCANSQQCNTAKVQITCGKSSLKKRHADNTSRSRETLEANIDIPIVEESVNGGDTFTQSKYLSLYHDVQEVIMRSTEEIFGNVTTELVDFVSTGLRIECPNGAVKSEHSLNCVDCPEGTFYMLRSGVVMCESCRKGTYQNETGQHSCIRCPYTTTTHTVGATTLEDCESACPPGRYSLDGLQPCSPCEQGFYQLSYGQSVCKSCPGSKSTLTTGTLSISECKEFDVRFAREGLSDVRHELLQPQTITDFTLSLWLQLTSTYNVTDDEDIMAITLYNAEHDEVWSWRNFAQVLHFNRKTATTYLELPDTRWHHIVLHTRACETSISIDGMPLPADHRHTPGATCSSITFNTVAITAGNSTEGVISQLNVWNSNKYHGFFKHRCYGNDVGNLLSWKSMEDAILYGAYLTLPSQCDDFNDCASNPCHHGSCEDKMDGFICTCFKGFQGTQCDINIDDCEVNLCMNNGTCQDGISTYTCNCETNYTGQFCEIEMVDGEWSDWGNWTECTTSCGNGTMIRKRLCNNPTPDNGGEDCVGKQFDTRNCNNTDCPVCPELHSPLNGTIQCDNDTVTSNCTISCDDGFDFDIEPLPLYYCGPETYHVWNFQTDINPERRFPKCVAIKMPEKLSVSYTAHYRDLYCDSLELETHAVEKINNTINTIITNVSCVVKETCEVSSIRIVDCYHGNRSRRDKRTAGFSLVISSHPTNDSQDDTISDLDDTFEDIHKAVNIGEADVVVLNDTYTIDDNLTDATGEVECGPGATRVSYYCIPCGQGSYLYQDYCEPCPVGTYQDIEGQPACIDCPEGRSTVGTYSTSMEDCIVAVLLTDAGYQVTGVIPGSLSGVIILLLSAFLCQRHRKRKVGQFSMSATGMTAATSTKTKTNGQLETVFELGTSTKTSHMNNPVLMTKYMSTSDKFGTWGVYRSKTDSIELKIGGGNVTQDHQQDAIVADADIVSLNEDIKDKGEEIPALSDDVRDDIDNDDSHDSDNDEVENVPRNGLDSLQKSATENEDILQYDLEDVHNE